MKLTDAQKDDLTQKFSAAFEKLLDPELVTDLQDAADLLGRANAYLQGRLVIIEHRISHGETDIFQPLVAAEDDAEEDDFDEDAYRCSKAESQ